VLRLGRDDAGGCVFQLQETLFHAAKVLENESGAEASAHLFQRSQHRLPFCLTVLGLPQGGRLMHYTVE
jgi:hypothetical protein